jgi:DNA polymerase-3 subunit epsilon
LLDSEILAEVYLELIGGRQPDFALNVSSSAGPDQTNNSEPAWRPHPRPTPLPSRLTEKESAAHAEFVEAMGDGALWTKLS